MKIECIKERHPIGARVKLTKMHGETQMEPGLEGTISFIDDIGQIHVKWDNGSALALNMTVDTFVVTTKEKGITVLLMEPHREPRLINLANTLKAMQYIVEGYVEQVSFFGDETAIYCNEEGKLNSLPKNRRIFDSDGQEIDYITGTFFVCNTPPDVEKLASLTPAQIEKYTRMFSLSHY